MSWEPWTDENVPSVVAFKPESARSAAEAICIDADWSALLECAPTVVELSALERHGLTAALSAPESEWRHVSVDRWPDRFRSGVLAWMAARVRQGSICVADDHDCDGWRTFNGCDGEDTPHAWMDVWFVDADADDFVRFVLALVEEWLS